MELRDYQAAAIKGIFAAWENCRSALAVLPTGCGKTIVFASVIRRLLAGGMSKTEGSRRVLVLAHREELIMQAKEKIVAVVPNAQIGIEMGEFKAHDFFGQPPDVVVSSIQTQCAPYGEQGEGRRRRMEKFNPKDFAAIIVDEAHRVLDRLVG